MSEQVGAPPEPARAGPLLALAREGALPVRVAALEVLVRLPLERGEWAEVEEVARDLAPDLPQDEELRRRALAAIARIPLASPRAWLRSVAGDPADPDHGAAVAALREVLDPSAAPWVAPLLRSGSEYERARAAQELTVLGARIEGFPERFEEDPDPDVRFWSAYGRALGGDGAPLQRLLEAVSEDSGALPKLFWGDPAVAEAALREAGELPPAVQAAVGRLAAEDGGEQRRVAEIIGEAQQPRGWYAPREPDPEAARSALGLTAGARVLDLSAFVHGRFLRAAASGRDLCNDLVSAVAALGTGFTPNPRGLYHTTSLLPGAGPSHDLLDQLAWTALQPSPFPALRALVAKDVSAEEQLARLAFLRRGLDVAAAGPPIRGAGGPVASARVPLLDEPVGQAAEPPLEAPPAASAPAGERSAPPADSAPRRPASPSPELEREMLERAQREMQQERMRSNIERMQHEMNQVIVRNLGGEAERERPRRIVSTGFETKSGDALVDRTLQTASPYRFFVEIGAERARGAIDVADVEVPVGAVPAGRILRVALFTFDGELASAPGAASGDFVFLADGTLAVLRQPGCAPLAEPAGRRLLFPVSTSAAPGLQRLRCNLYLDNVLLLSKLVSAQAAEREVEHPGALRSEADFVFSGTLDPGQLRELRPHLLSVMLNDDGAGTHGFRLLGEDFQRDARIQEGDVASLVEAARKRLRWASWGDEQELDGARSVSYRYAKPVPRAELRQHLFSLARAGRRAWDVLVQRLAGSAEAQQELKALMRKPGRVQIVSKESARLVIPAAMFYDRPPRTAIPDDELRLCEAFTAALDDPGPLEDAACFRGECPNLDDDHVMCPSGFWGFRHELGMPCSVGAGADGAVVIPGTRPLSVLAAVATDLSLWEAHLRELRPCGIDVERAVKSVPEFLLRYRAGDQQLVYLYGHGGSSEGNPYFVIGGPGSELLLRDSLQEFIPAVSRHPLVFLNGCRSAGLAPEQAVDLVSGFVRTGRASGVMGTEISVFEELATEFARECLRRFVVERMELGAATRGARLALLKKGNPLGLVYIPYAPVDLRLVDGPAGAVDP